MAKDNISPEERARRIKEMEASDVYDPSNPKNLYDNDMTEGAGDQTLGAHPKQMVHYQS